MRTASLRRDAVHRAMTAATISERRACRFTGVARATVRYPAMRDDTPLTEQLETLAMEHPRWGYRRLHWRLERDGVHVNHKRVQRVYRAAGLHVRRRRRKRVSRARVPHPTPTMPNERWSMDFVSDTLGNGQSVRVFTLVDDCSRESPGLLVHYVIGAARITEFLDTLPTLPRTLVCDNGPEFTSQHSDHWADARDITLQFIRPGKPIENCFIESFNGRLRDECLNESWFVDLADAQRTIEAWRIAYNTARPHSALDNRTPSEFANSFTTMTPSLPNPHDRYE